MDWPLLRERDSQYRKMAAAVATFRELAMPAISIAIVASARSTTSWDTTTVSEPKTKQVGKAGTTCGGYKLPVVCSAATTQVPAALALRTNETASAI